MINVHLPTSWRPLQEFRSALHHITDAIQEINKAEESCTIILAGDMNVELWTTGHKSKEKNDDRAHDLLDWLAEWNLEPDEEEMTRHADEWAFAGANTKKHIDYVFMN